jgi:hypothetical protein
MEKILAQLIEFKPAKVNGEYAEIKVLVPIFLIGKLFDVATGVPSIFKIESMGQQFTGVWNPSQSGNVGSIILDEQFLAQCKFGVYDSSKFQSVKEIYIII